MIDNKKRIEYIIPPVAIDMARCIRKVLQNPTFSNLTRKNRLWKDKYEGGRVIIVANGPSIGQLDIKLLKGEKVIVMNSFDRALWKDEVNIVAHCIGEPRSSSAWSEAEVAGNINGTNSHSYWLDSSCWKQIRNINKNKQIHYIFAAVESGIWGARRFELHRSTMGFQTTAQLAIQVALYMGFRDIGLVGFDHDWLASRDYLRHFYSMTCDDTDKLSEFSYQDIIRVMDRMWKIYYQIRVVANTYHAQIYNLTPGGFLDVFPRLSIESFVKRTCIQSQESINCVVPKTRESPS